MANWAYKVNFKDFYGEYDEGKLSLQNISRLVVEELYTLLSDIRKEPEVDISIHASYRDEFLELADDLESTVIEQFLLLSDDEFADEEAFNYCMDELYDWADTSLDNKFGGVKMCWVKTR